MGKLGIDRKSPHYIILPEPIFVDIDSTISQRYHLNLTASVKLLLTEALDARRRMESDAAGDTAAA